MPAEKEPAKGAKAETKEFKLTDDQKQFLELAKTTGLKFDLETEEGRHDFEIEANKWVASGKPLPKFPEQPKQEEEPIPMKLYRTKVFGVQKMFWRDTKAVLHGKHIEKVETKHKSADGTQTFTRTQEVPKHTMDFDAKEAGRLATRAQELCRTPTFYIVIGDYKYSVTPQDWVEGDFDELVRAHKEKRYFK